MEYFFLTELINVEANESLKIISVQKRGAAVNIIFKNETKR